MFGGDGNMIEAHYTPRHKLVANVDESGRSEKHWISVLVGKQSIEPSKTLIVGLGSVALVVGVVVAELARKG